MKKKETKPTRMVRQKNTVFHVRGEPWTIILASSRMKNRGECDYEQKAIRLSKGSKYMRDTLIHEVLHAALPDLAEEAVVETAEAIDKAFEAVDDWDLF